MIGEVGLLSVEFPQAAKKTLIKLSQKPDEHFFPYPSAPQ
jgi:uncharacterized protein YjeT (DUF2065 family)